MKDDAYGVPMARAQAAHAVTKFNSVGAAGALYRTVVHRENHAIALSQWDDFAA